MYKTGKSGYVSSGVEIMLNKEMIEINLETFKKHLTDQEVIDKGEVLIETAKDYELLLKYIESLRQGDETYKPEGLVFINNNEQRNLL